MKAGDVICVIWITPWVIYGTCTNKDPSALRVGWVSFEKLWVVGLDFISSGQQQRDPVHCAAQWKVFICLKMISPS